MGNLARLFAHSFRKYHPQVPITLLFHRSSLLDEWEAAGHNIDITTNDVVDTQTNFDIELISGNGSARETPIENLILTVKTHSTVSALAPIASRLNRNSTIMFVQNGMGVYDVDSWLSNLMSPGTVDEVFQAFYPDSRNRPNSIVAIVNHGVFSKGPFSSVHAGIASTSFGLTKASESSVYNSNAQYMADMILNCPPLIATQYPSDLILSIQLRKLVINSVVNPLSTIYDCINGDIFTKERDPLIRALVGELAQVTQALLKHQPELAMQFTQQALLDSVYEVGAKVAKNISSMRQDMMAGRKTEIDYINGYIVKKGHELDIPVPCNELLVNLIKSRTKKDVIPIPQ